MTYGPFQTKEGGDTIAIFTKDELFPLIQEIRQLAIKVSTFRVGFWGSFFRKKLSQIDEEYKNYSAKFIEKFHKWSTPDILFQEIEHPPGSKESAMVIADYFNSQGAIMQHFNEGFRLLSYIDRIITEQSTASYNRISITLAILAITVSIIVIILK